MKYVCSECSTQLNKFEIELNKLYPVDRLYCEFCQNKYERKIIKHNICNVELQPNICDV